MAKLIAFYLYRTNRTTIAPTAPLVDTISFDVDILRPVTKVTKPRECYVWDHHHYREGPSQNLLGEWNEWRVEV